MSRPATSSVRSATADDVPLLAALERELFGPEAWSAASLDAEMAAPGRRVLVHDDGEVAGWAVTIVAGDVVDLARIAVRPERRREGVAHGLLDRALADAAAAGAERVLLEVSSGNPGALSFYAREGFERIDVRPRYYRDSTDAVILQRVTDRSRDQGGRR